MKLNLDKFLPKLAMANSVVNPKVVIPIQGDFLLHTENGLLYINASDGENTVSVAVQPTEFSDLCVCVNANDFYKALANLRGEEIEIVLNEEKHLLRCVYKSGYFQIPYEYDEAASAVLKIQNDTYHIENDMNAADLLEAVTNAEVASSDNNIRPQFCGVHFDFKQDGMVAVATDGSKLSKFKTTIKTTEDMSGFTIQKKSAHILTVLMANEDTVTMKVGDKSVLFSGEDFTMTARLSEYTYPNYDCLIPTETRNVAIVNKDSLLSAIKRVSPLGDEKDEMLKMTFGDNTLIIQAEDICLSKLGKEKIPCQYDSEQMTIGVKSENIVALVQVMVEEEVEISFNSPQTPILIRPKSDSGERFTTLAMPLVFKSI